MKISRSIQHYLYFTQRERHGALALLLLCLFLFALPPLYHRLKPKSSSDFTAIQAEVQRFNASFQREAEAPSLFHFDPNTLDSAGFIRLGLTEKQARAICRYRGKGGQFRKVEDFRKLYGLSEEDFQRLQPFIFINKTGEKRGEEQKREPFPFDPNTATAEDFTRLGLPEKTVQSILNYRSKGGKFRTAADFAKIYALPAADFERLEPYIQIQPSAKFAASSKTIDINLASLEDWGTLPGIGEKRAQMILNYREKLGGFTQIEQLGQCYGVPDSVFQKIRPRLALSQATIKKIDLNSASVDLLDAHPYISKKQAIALVRYREQHGPFKQLEDLEQVIALQADKSWLDKVQPYLQF